MFPGEPHDFTGYTQCTVSRLKSGAISGLEEYCKVIHMFLILHKTFKMYEHCCQASTSLFMFLLFLYLGLQCLESHIKLCAISEALMETLEHF